MGRIFPILKIIGASFALVAGSAFEAIGISHLCLSHNKKEEAREVYSQSEEYQNKKQYEEEKLGNLKVKFEQVEGQYHNAEILYDDYIGWKETYEKELNYYNNEFFDECLENTQIKEVKDLYDSSDNMFIPGFIFTVLGAIVFIVKGGICYYRSDVNCYFSPCGEYLIEVITDSAGELGDIHYERKQEKIENKKAKKSSSQINDKQEKQNTQEEPEEKLTDVEDQYYNY